MVSFRGAGYRVVRATPNGTRKIQNFEPLRRCHVHADFRQNAGAKCGHIDRVPDMPTL